jgi:cytochrome o ubiquinol oxidase subunit 2
MVDLRQSGYIDSRSAIGIFPSAAQLPMSPFVIRHRAGRGLALALLTALLGGCDTVVMKPHGDVAVQQAQLIVQSTFLMLLIIVPVMAATLIFAFRYRQSNTAVPHTPDWDHSTRLELLIWGAPLLIIIALGTITWISTHKLDPYRPLDRIGANRALAPGVKPLVVDVVALDWKWLFIYPEHGIATVNEMAAPVDRPIQFRITASNMMNSFYIPALAGQVYAMPGMETKLHAVINRPGRYDGFSANYSGAGFSDMRFKFLGQSDAEFAQWIEANRRAGQQLTRAAYLQLEKPSQAEPVRRWGRVEQGLYDAIVNRCADPQKMCTRQMMAIDAAGGGGKGGVAGLTQQPWGAEQQRTVVAALCTASNPTGAPMPAPVARATVTALH